MSFHHLWLWQNKTDINDNVISWCSQQQCGTMKAPLPHSLNDLKPEFSKLREGLITLSLKELLGNEIASTFESWIINRPANKTLCINLLNSLPEQWQSLPLERCQYNGTPLSHYAQIIRNAPLPKKALAQSLSSKTTLLNTWPAKAYDENFFADLPRDFTHVHLGLKGVDKRFKHNNVANQSLLCVIAHGNEDDTKRPLLSECEQHTWAILPKPLPPLVIILACGGKQGNLHDYALKLLQEEPDPPNNEGVSTAYGAKTVLVAYSKLDAAQANVFIKNFLKKWQTGQSANGILYQLQQERNSEHAAMRLHVIGQSQLRQVIAEKNNHAQALVPSSWEELIVNARTDDNALVMLLNHLTRHILVEYSNIESVVDALYTALDYEYNDPQEEKHLVYDRLNRVYSVCDHLTKAWLSCFLLYLSSMHNHNQITFYEKEASELESIPMAGREIFLFHRAQAKCRERNYVKAIQMFIEGITSLSQRKKTCSEAEYKFFEMAVNLLVDVSLTNMAMYFFKKANKCINSSAIDNKQHLNEVFTQLDREARLLARIGDSDNEEKGELGLRKGIGLLNKKRHKAMHSRKANGERELSALLLFSAWQENPELSYLKTALKVLHKTEQMTQNITDEIGNSGKLYLLKGVANWAWQQHDKEAIKLLAPYKPFLIKLCLQAEQQEQDSGPLGAIMAYMHLMDKDDETIKQAWNAIAYKMQSQFHYFELTMFYALMNEEKKSAVYYKEFKEQQQSVLDELKQLEPSVLDAAFDDRLKETEEQLDSDPMNESGTTFSTDLDVIRRSGLVPF